MPELPVTSARPDQVPPVFLEEPDDFAHFHGVISSREGFLRANGSALTGANPHALKYSAGKVVASGLVSGAPS